MAKGRRFNQTDRTAKDALDELEGRVKDGTLSPIAEELQRRQRIREAQDTARNERLRNAREPEQGPSGGDAA